MWRSAKVLSDKTMQRIAQQLFSLAKFGESGIALTWPRSDIDYRINRFLSDSKLLKKLLGRYYRRYIFVTLKERNTTLWEELALQVVSDLKIRKVDISPKDTDGISGVCSQAVSRGFEVFVYVLNAELIFASKRRGELEQIKALVEKSPRINGLLVFEEDCQSRDYFTKIPKRFLQNTLLLPLYGKKDTRQFIRFLEKEWDITVAEIDRQKIISECGGHLWLVKEAVRFVRNNPSGDIQDAFKTRNMRLKTELVWQKLLPVQQQVLIDIYKGNNKKVSEHLSRDDYLFSLGLVRQKGEDFELGVPLLSRVIRGKLSRQRLSFDKSGKILFDGDDANHMFSPGERKLLIELLVHKGKVVERGQLASVLWGERSNFSDWALDKTVHRLRKKLEALGFESEIIKTKKKVGFVLGSLADLHGGH